MKPSVKAMFMFCLAIISMIATHRTATAGENVGVRQIVAHSDERQADLAVTVWYPASTGGSPVTLGESMFFTGTPAMRDAPVSQGRFPLVLLSHGAGLAGHPDALSWIAAPLAQKGFIVAAPAHPGNSGPGRSAAETMKLWLRPADIGEAFEAMGEDTFFKDHLQVGNTGILGLSMGGNTALAVAGARIAPQLLSGYCDGDEANSSLCGWVTQSGVDLHAMDMRSAGRDNRDERFRFAMAIDPAPVNIFEQDTFSRISIPVEIINLGSPRTMPASVRASEIAKAIPASRYTAIEDASHYSMFAECKTGMADIAVAEIGEPICADGARRSRSEIHRQLIGLVADAFSRTFKSVN